MTPAERELALSAALLRATVALPWLAGLARAVNIASDERVSTACVFPSGRILVGTRFVDHLEPMELAFVVAHELLHLAIASHERHLDRNEREAWLANEADDYHINDLLEHAMDLRTPAGGLRSPGARLQSPEEIFARLLRRPERERPPRWTLEASGGLLERPVQGRLGDALVRAGIVELPPKPRAGEGDVELGDDALEHALFPGLSRRAQARRRAEVAKAASEAVKLSQLGPERLEVSRAGSSANGRGLFEVHRARHRPPWDLALQRWVEDAAPGRRTYARPSRRSNGRQDIVLPGRLREGWTLNVILDSSGSMVGLIPPVLGTLSAFCAAARAELVRVVQCDQDVTKDELVDVAELATFEVRGLGASDLTPAFERLAASPDVTRVLVLTDGETAHPSEAPPYQVLWAIVGNEAPTEFPFGTVLRCRP